MTNKISSLDIRRQKKLRKLSALTCYDYSFAQIVDGEVDLILVGDSLGMVMQGHKSTLQVTMEQMLYHTQCVSRAIRKSQLVADMPFLSYHLDPREALKNAGRLVAEGGAEAVKLEGGESILPAVEKIVRAGIPVLGHLGLLPQSVHQTGGFKVQGREEAAAQSIIRDAQQLESAGAYAIVLEMIPWPLAKQITETVSIPTIGIGAGPHCDGQILVLQDLLGMNANFKPRFVRRYENLTDRIKQAVSKYREEVESIHFPNIDESFES